MGGSTRTLPGKASLGVDDTMHPDEPGEDASACYRMAQKTLNGPNATSNGDHKKRVRLRKKTPSKNHSTAIDFTRLQQCGLTGFEQMEEYEQGLSQVKKMKRISEAAEAKVKAKEEEKKRWSAMLRKKE